MKIINLVFDEDDADLLLLPDNVAENLDILFNKFSAWLRIPENEERFLVPHNGKRVLGINTKDIVWWLNTYATSSDEKVIILKQNVKPDPQYPMEYY